VGRTGRVLRVVGRPVFRYVEARFDNVDARLARLERLKLDERAAKIAETLDECRQFLGRLERDRARAELDLQTSAELLVVFQRTAGLIERRLSRLEEVLTRESARRD
jgi:ABC-type transporter Mla subunit MlaD